MKDSVEITKKRICMFFDCFKKVFDDCGSLLNDENYASRKEIVLTTLFSVLSLFATAYCCGGKRNNTKIQNEEEFIKFLEKFWDSEEKNREFEIIANNRRKIRLNGKRLLWKIRNLLAHEFRTSGMGFPSQMDEDVIISCPVENHSTKQTNTEFEIHPHNFLRDMIQMSESYRLYCLTQELDPRMNLPYRELYLN